uniref:Odorant receptor n=1 Tax=Planotortrix octo TaxID=65038 RepID=A0A0B5GQ24_9NEOP|nr:olfactory receptor OR54 [Planotortrix octo]
MKNSQCLSSSIAVMKYSGVWKPDGLTYRWEMAYKIFGFVTQVLFFYFIILAEIGYVYTFLDNVERMVDAAVLLLSHLVQAVKVMTIILRQGRIKRMIEMVDGPAFTKSDPKLKAILESSTRLAAMVGNVILCSACTTGIFWGIVPALNPELTLPLRTAYPFDIHGPYIFPAMYAYSSISVIVVGVGDAAENFLVSGLFTLASAQVDVLREELKAIGADGCTDNFEKATLCVKYHQRIIGYVEEMADIFGLPMFCQFVTTSVVICMTIYKITVTQEPVEMVTMVFYLMCVFMELLMYCYPGDVLLNKSLLVSEAAYPNDWSNDKRTSRVLLLTALRAQRPLAIDAGGMFRVCLPTAAAVVQTSYSYYALVRQQLAKE